MIVAVEDVLSEAIARKLIAVVRPDLSVSSVLRKNGRDYIEHQARKLNQTAHKIPVLILVDLDRPVPCPADLIAAWLPSPSAPKLLFRVAVMEIESWIMADRDAFAGFMSVPLHRVPENPDQVGQPKELVVSIARKSRKKDIREDLVPASGDTRSVGPGYNARLTSFITEVWNPRIAARASRSLRKTLDRLATAF